VVAIILGAGVGAGLWLLLRKVDERRAPARMAEAGRDHASDDTWASSEPQHPRRAACPDVDRGPARPDHLDPAPAPQL